MTYQPHIQEYKKREVEDVKRLFAEYPVVGLVNMEGLPTKTLQRMKKSLLDKIVIKITRKRFMEIAMDNMKGKKNIAELKEKLEGIPALIFTKEEPFTLYRLLEKSKTPAPAKPGQKAPFDITIPAGPTPFAPGPMIGELGQLGIKTEVKEGKISVREDKLILQEGDAVTQKIAELLVKLGIEPMKLGMNLLLTYEKGEILTKKVLHIDEDAYYNSVKEAYASTLALAMHLCLIMPETAVPLIQGAFRQAKFLAEKANILTPETMGKTLAEAERAAESISKKLPNMPPPQQPATPPHPPAEQSSQEEKKKLEIQLPQLDSPPSRENQEEKEEHPLKEKPHQEKPSPPPTTKAIHPEEAIESKQPIEPSEMERAEKFLKDLTEKTVKVGDSKKAEPRVEPEQDISKLINTLKDKKSRGEL